MAALRVGIVLYGTDRPLQGVTRAALGLRRALQQSSACELVCLAASRSPRPSGRNNVVQWTLPGCSRLPALMALGGPLIALAARRLRLDVVHDPVGVSPFTLGRWAGLFTRVVTIHDAAAFRYPEGYPWLNNALHRRYVPATLPNVDLVLTDSEASRADLTRFLRIPGDRLRVVPLGVDDTFRPVADARRVAARYGLSRPYILSVGARQARKNLPRLVGAFAQLHSSLPAYQLAIVGPRLWTAGDVDGQRSPGLEDAVVSPGYVPDHDLPSLYAGASLFVFPSLFEGFGLPVLEAMACGTPVVCSNASSLPEVAGDAAMLVDPYDVQRLAQAMERVLGDGQLAAELRRRGAARAAQFTWERTSRLALAAYRDAVDARARG